VAVIFPLRSSFVFPTGSNFVADQCGSNVYFLDPTTESIRVISSGYVKTLISLDEVEHNVQMIAHDLKNQ